MRPCGARPGVAGLPHLLAPVVDGGRAGPRFLDSGRVTATAPTGAELPTGFDAAEVEGRLYDEWVERGLFTPTGEGEPYCIVIPPPNVTGRLHLGHALDHTLIDAYVRRRRMQGYDALWLPGIDHAGIATQNVVERQLASEGLSRHDLGREAFVRRVWEWKAEYGSRITDQMRRLGDGVDWTRERFTMDEGMSRAVRAIFVRLHAAGLVYRANRIINWCPRCLTALSDIEVDHSDDDGELVSISYGPLVVATTRAETMLGDTAVAVHPDDERYAHLVGTEVELPLTGRRIPVVADDHVDPEFGTGAVKVTPAHDPNDFAIGERHRLQSITVMDERGVITAPGPFAGLDRFEARPAVVAALREAGRVVQERRPYVHSVGHCSRCGTVVEPRLSLQWWVSVAPLAKAAGDAVRDGRTELLPPSMVARWSQWVDHMNDWTVSRQLWWGHRIPVWYCGDGHETVAETDPSACGTCGAGDLVQDPDVLDTWFSSALFPFSTLGWPDETEDLARYYPNAVLVTGYDILFFWVARMMMFGLFAREEVPFRTVFLHGLVRDERGRKMSKSLGNAVDPLDWIDAYGADAVRFTLARGANPGVDIPVGEDWVRASRSFVTKVWNATRFALARGADPRAPLPAADALGPADRWVLSRLAATVQQVDASYEGSDFARACEALFHFAWDEVFDWYLELSKPVLAVEGPAADATRAVLGHVLDVLLRLLHPVAPFVTDELWRRLTGGDTLVTASWPVADAGRADAQAEAEVALVQQVVTEVRRFRAEQGLAPGRRVPAVLVTGADARALAGWTPQLASLAALDVSAAQEVPDGWPTLQAPGGAVVALDVASTLDVVAERGRLERDLAKALGVLEKADRKLATPAFVERASEQAVAKARGQATEARETVERLQERLALLPTPA